MDFGIRDHGPIIRRGDVQSEAALQIRLVEAGKGHAGIHGYKQAVNVFAVVVAIVKARKRLSGRCDRYGEAELNGVLSYSQPSRRQFQVTVLGFRDTATPFTDALLSWPSRKSISSGCKEFRSNCSSSWPEVESAFRVKTNATWYFTSEIAAARCLASSRGMPRGTCAKTEGRVNKRRKSEAGMDEAVYCAASLVWSIAQQ